MQNIQQVNDKKFARTSFSSSGFVCKDSHCNFKCSSPLSISSKVNHCESSTEDILRNATVVSIQLKYNEGRYCLYSFVSPHQALSPSSPPHNPDYTCGRQSQTQSHTFKFRTNASLNFLHFIAWMAKMSHVAPAQKVISIRVFIIQFHL